MAKRNQHRRAVFVDNGKMRAEFFGGNATDNGNTGIFRSVSVCDVPPMHDEFFDSFGVSPALLDKAGQWLYDLLGDDGWKCENIRNDDPFHIDPWNPQTITVAAGCEAPHLYQRIGYRPNPHKLKKLNQRQQQLAVELCIVLTEATAADALIRYGDAAGAARHAATAGYYLAICQVREVEYKAEKYNSSKSGSAAGNAARSAAAAENQQQAVNRLKFLIEKDRLGVTDAVNKCIAEGLGGSTYMWKTIYPKVKASTSQRPAAQ